MLAITNGHKDLIPLLSPDEFNRSTLEPSGASLDISSKNCAICHVPFDPNDVTKPIVVLPCSIHHRFHSKCIDHKTSCPICLSTITHHEQYSNIIENQDHYQSLLIDSIQNCNKEAFDESLKYRIDPNIPDKNGRAPLALVGHYTYKSESVKTPKDMMISLIKHGAYIGNNNIKSYFLERYHDILEEAGAFDNVSYAGRRSFRIPLDKELFCESSTQTKHKYSDGSHLRSHG
ncbi:hypothetical protein [Cardinium endosymbiont of Culicoides punctatus]|uniref:hypothetical protein n=1 Tax=Cardinium endosymbiont of Culicoides punctatus TaxID=2304601 RepID=UPI0010586697|nr:hypothetical protein CCPUN_06920 [Cardinium endosymbiont of Culicoides punctatus]